MRKRSSSGALFRRIRRGDHVTLGRLTVVSSRRIIKVRAQAAGLEGFISGHSLRVGSAVSLARGNASLVEIQVDGRWKDSRMPSHYASVEIAKNSETARIKYGKGKS